MNIYISVTHANTNIYILKLEKKEKEKMTMVWQPSLLYT